MNNNINLKKKNSVNISDDLNSLNSLKKSPIAIKNNDNNRNSGSSNPSSSSSSIDDNQKQ